MYVSPFKGDPQRARAPMPKAHAVRKKFHASMKWKSDIFIKFGLREISGEQILDTFIDAKMLSTQFMSFFVACISHDERRTADGGGYRVFLSQELGVSESFTDPQSNHLYMCLCQSTSHPRICQYRGRPRHLTMGITSCPSCSTT
ncbi:unnamed protein product [Urochloa humidicola]